MTNSYEEILEKEGVLYTTNVGVSMRPLLRARKDVLIIRPPERAYQKYDVVLFRRPGVNGRGAYVVHRILKVLPENRYWIVGDNCISGETVAGENILGLLCALRRGGKDFDLRSPRYRLYLRFWVAPYPLRFVLLRAKHFLRRCVSFCKRRILKKTA